MKVFTKKTFFIISYVFLSTALYSQVENGYRKNVKSDFYRTLLFDQSKVADTIILDEEITSMTISIDLNDVFDHSILIHGMDTFHIQEDLHEPPSPKEKFSQLIVFERPIKSFVFIRGEIEGDVLFHLLNSGIAPKINNNKNHKRLNQDCGRPNTVDQPTWRAGLPAPNYDPSYSKVNHLIVHHTAGSNTNTDYTNVVRQIYLYHTEVRNYSDIAYNFLIAQDGTIYEGREGEGDREEDVIGAHFCAKNTNTMGISLLGNYETAVPSRSMLSALEYLMAWKLSKEGLDPFGSNSHPVGSANASALGTISTHKDGCATLCPGVNVYSLIDLLKQNTDDAIKNRISNIPLPEIVSNERQGEGRVTLEVSGGADGGYIWFTSEKMKDSIPGAINSKYSTPFLSETTSFYVALKEGNCIGPMLKIDAVVEEDRFLVYPNPTDGLVTISLNESFLPSNISIINSVGQRLAYFQTEIVNNKISIDTSYLSKGVYFLVLKSAGKTVNKKLMIN